MYCVDSIDRMACHTSSITVGAARALSLLKRHPPHPPFTVRVRGAVACSVCRSLVRPTHPMAPYHVLSVTSIYRVRRRHPACIVTSERVKSARFLILIPLSRYREAQRMSTGSKRLPLPFH